ncbi:hypothetical protein D1631_14300 [Chryseobacterium nematophagum]|uniref:Uncharacterized protein n=1 Tax=Chryseobacterium nematophagum TaxID=2305228 RepID=A0A3M7TK41_9FLAO|nr:hypothetical protein [Chryseobacterium nematophagum]RNA63019.1 hypothetical protein D1631_14300 [Chryseobacterium nematophagum]
MKEIKEIQYANLALTQYYRWYQVYEVPFTDARIENQKDILDEDIVIDSLSGVSKGKADLKERISIFKGWKNAHHVQSTQVKLISDEKLSLEADIIYQNIRPDASRISYTIHYSTELKLGSHDLPVFTKVNIAPTGEIKEFEFKEAYTENRSKSFMHYWLHCIDTCNENSIDRFKELLAHKMTVDEGDEKFIINSQDQLKTWILSITSGIKTGAHQPKNFVCKSNEDGTISVSVDLERLYVSKEDKNLIEKTHQEWVLENNMDERFARIRSIKITRI